MGAPFGQQLIIMEMFRCNLPILDIFNMFLGIVHQIKISKCPFIQNLVVELKNPNWMSETCFFVIVL